MLKISINNHGLKRKQPLDTSSLKREPNSVLYSENFFKANLITNLRARVLAIGIFLYYFVENGTLGLVPPKFYMVYRNMRISDFLLYFMVGYSFVKWEEYRNLLSSKKFMPVKILLLYLLFEFGISYFRYDFNPIEYFFRLKIVWVSFMIFPVLLLLKRGGFPFLVKLFFPVSVISNFLYLLTSLTGIPFLPDVSIVSQYLPGDIEIFRVFGGTFYGELFFLGIVYYWITKRFRFWQLGPAALFIIPHVLAFGRLAWVGFAFTILLMVLINSLNKKNYKILIRQTVMLILAGISITFVFIKFIPESDYYMRALNARIFQGQDEIKYGEGTYGTRVIMQNSALLNLWMKNDIFLGIGMHPMWVVGGESREEMVLYGAFSDVTWPGVLAAYGIIGFGIAVFIQFYYMFLSFKYIKNSKNNNIYTFMITLLLAKLLFDSTVGFSYVFISTSILGLSYMLNIYIPFIVYTNEEKRSHRVKINNL